MYILHLAEETARRSPLTGVKGATLADLKQAGLPVPEGFVILPEAFVVGELKEAALSEVEEALENTAEDMLFAVRPSAVVADIEEASFAGMFDTVLDVPRERVTAAVNMVYASSRTEAVDEHVKAQGLDFSQGMAVLVQRMAASDFSGLLRTADPRTSDRHTVVIEAVAGSGEYLASGRKATAVWRIRGGAIRGASQVLSHDLLMRLSGLGKSAEAHFGAPQEIEWCLSEGAFQILQSRPIAKLFPLPELSDSVKRCYLSDGHMRMMTDAIRPLGLSFAEWLNTAGGFTIIGGRAYIDITNDLKTGYGRSHMLSHVQELDPLMHIILQQVASRKEYIKALPSGGKAGLKSPPMRWGSLILNYIRISLRNNPADLDDYEARMRTQNEELSEHLSGLFGSDLLEAIRGDQNNLEQIINDPFVVSAIMVAEDNKRRVDETAKLLTGTPHFSNQISKSVGHSIVSQMSIALLELSDSIRPYPSVITYMKREKYYDRQKLEAINGGAIVAEAIDGFIARYGMRGSGEIDITRNRFYENPAELFPLLVSNAETLPFRYGKIIFDQGRAESRNKIRELLKLSRQKSGARRTKKLERQISLFRNFTGTREYARHFQMCRYEVYKRALMREAARLKENGQIDAPEDIFNLYFEEMQDLFIGGNADRALIERRRKTYRQYQEMTPPRVLFSDGEAPVAGYNVAVPPNSLPGLAVSGGEIKGRARIISSIQEARLEPGDILVAVYTDTSWTPIFFGVAALVTEIGGMMAHGAIIMREYGKPAVVGVAGATALIRDGDLIRVNGDKGFVEIVERGGKPPRKRLGKIQWSSEEE